VRTAIAAWETTLLQLGDERQWYLATRRHSRQPERMFARRSRFRDPALHTGPHSNGPTNQGPRHGRMRRLRSSPSHGRCGTATAGHWDDKSVSLRLMEELPRKDAVRTVAERARLCPIAYAESLPVLARLAAASRTLTPMKPPSAPVRKAPASVATMAAGREI
jgi:hypothetical protein